MKAKRPGLLPPVSLDTLAPALLWGNGVLASCIGSLLFLLLGWETSGEFMSVVGISIGLWEKLEVVIPGCCTGTGGAGLVGGGGWKVFGDAPSFCVNGSYGFWEKPGMLMSVLVTMVGGCRLIEGEDV